MQTLHSLPISDGFHMPGEYEPHQGTIMIWPVRPGSWPYHGKEAQHTFTQIAQAISESETVWMLAAPEYADEVRTIFQDNSQIHVLEIPTDDAWARDVGPTFVINEHGDIRGIDWQFNAWGGTYDGLYAHWKQDNLAASRICSELNIDCYDAQHFVLEGGSIHSDGEGTVLVTKSCLLSPGRNPDLTKEQIEQELKNYLGAEKVIWLPRGIYMDETNEHVDNVCCFARPGEVILAWTDNQKDPQWELSNATLHVLENETDAKGRHLTIHKLPIPKQPVCITEQELQGFQFEEGEDQREAGERLAASYVNFYITNGGVIIPQFGDEADATAIEILSGLFPSRRIYPIEARSIIVGGGNIHCITQQIPMIHKNTQSVQQNEQH